MHDSVIHMGAVLCKTGQSCDRGKQVPCFTPGKHRPLHHKLDYWKP